jgi:UTP-glucose-1-phosphate uridylyltransferase
MNTDITLLILAAGKGSRYGGIKQFDTIGHSGEYLLEYSIYDAITAGFEKIVIVTSKESKEELSDYLSYRIPSSVSLTCISQDIEDTPTYSNLVEKRIKPWGTGHAVWSARNVIFGPFVTINADDYYGRQAFRIAFKIGNSIGTEDRYGLVVYPLKNTLSKYGTVSRGICKLDSSRLLNISEFTKLAEVDGVISDEKTNRQFTGEEPVSMNLWILTPKMFSAIDDQFTDFIRETKDLEKDELYLPYIIQTCVDKNEVLVDALNTDSKWMGMTYASDRVEVVSTLNEYVGSGHYPSKLWQNQ